jgi:hypothetical protein
MSKLPVQHLGNISCEQVVIVPDLTADPNGFQLPSYAEDPGAEANNPGCILYNSTTQTVDVCLNNQTYSSLAFAGAATAYGGAQDADDGAPFAVSSGVWTPITSDIQSLPCNLVTPASNFALTFNGTSTIPMQVIYNTSLSQDQANNSIYISLFLNGELYTNGGKSVVQLIDGVAANTHVSLNLSTIIMMNPGDQVQAALTLVGTSGNVTPSYVQFYISQL